MRMHRHVHWMFLGHRKTANKLKGLDSHGQFPELANNVFFAKREIVFPKIEVLGSRVLCIYP